MQKKNLLIIITILLTILLIAFVVWTYNKRIKRIEDKMQTGNTFILRKTKNEPAQQVDGKVLINDRTKVSRCV